MAYSEVDFCRQTEFDVGKEKRLTEEMLNLGGLYTVYFALKKVESRRRREAVKLPSRIHNKETLNDLGLHIIHFSLLNSKLEPTMQTKSQSFDGILAPTPAELVIMDLEVDPPDKYPIALGYFKKYERPQNGEDEVPTEVYVPNNELVLA